jgi:hypothetical protein
MELKTARLTLLIDPHKKAAFERLCAQRDLTPSQVVRQMVRDYLLAHGVSYTPSGNADAQPEATPVSIQQARKKAAKRPAATAAKVAARPPQRARKVRKARTP